MAIQIFQVCKMGISPHDTTNLAADVVYILTSCTSCSLQKEEPCFKGVVHFCIPKCAFIQ